MVISIYDIQRAVADKATVPIYYESRRIAVDVYNALVALRPDWASTKNDDDAVAAVCDRRTPEDDGAHRAPLQGRTCVVKVVMSGNADGDPDTENGGQGDRGMLNDEFGMSN